MNLLFFHDALCRYLLLQKNYYYKVKCFNNPLPLLFCQRNDTPISNCFYTVGICQNLREGNLHKKIIKLAKTILRQKDKRIGVESWSFMKNFINQGSGLPKAHFVKVMAKGEGVQKLITSFKIGPSTLDYSLTLTR